MIHPSHKTIFLPNDRTVDDECLLCGACNHESGDKETWGDLEAPCTGDPNKPLRSCPHSDYRMNEHGSRCPNCGVNMLKLGTDP